MLEKMRHEVELLSRHMAVLRTVALHQPIGINKLSEILDLPFHRIRYSLRVLEQMGYIRASHAGAMATGRAEELFTTIDRDIDDLIILLKGVRGPGT
ncbi:MAG: hypothetical protein NT074_05285 [Methanomicrobiales archaeon]|jgi:predicted transcriptional regulator|nr:hypothetical protein [Methanomicrobiales archaeon]